MTGQVIVPETKPEGQHLGIVYVDPLSHWNVDAVTHRRIFHPDGESNGYAGKQEKTAYGHRRGKSLEIRENSY